MIKKLQMLRAKKGFTLVELIVVIAIIGVLAAILIPTMIGYVKSANVTAADQQAAAIRKTVTNTISQLETKGCVTNKSVTATIIGTITQSRTGSGFTFAGNPSGLASGKKIDGNGDWDDSSWSDAVIAALKKDLTEAKPGNFMIVIENGTCSQAAYSASATFSSKITEFTAEEGVDANGNIIGTNPKVYKMS